jgi:hypothetical protein
MLPELGTAPLLQFVEPVTDEVPALSFDFSVTLAARVTKALAAKIKPASNGILANDKNRLAEDSDGFEWETFIF